jgi:hypothetical protein
MTENTNYPTILLIAVQKQQRNLVFMIRSVLTTHYTFGVQMRSKLGLSSAQLRLSYTY